MGIRGNDYRYIISRVSKSKVVNLLKNDYLSEKSGSFKIIKKVCYVKE